MPPGIKIRANLRSSAVSINSALTSFTTIPVTSGTISTHPLAATTVSFVRRFIHSPEWTALTAV